MLTMGRGGGAKAIDGHSTLSSNRPPVTVKFKCYATLMIELTGARQTLPVMYTHTDSRREISVCRCEREVICYGKHTKQQRAGTAVTLFESEKVVVATGWPEYLSGPISRPSPRARTHSVWRLQTTLVLLALASSPKSTLTKLAQS
jgi:hypothetical protein